MAIQRARLGAAKIEDGQAAGVYGRLRDLIVRGQLAPGARLVERDIATRLGTSRTPVRAALQRLQQERFVLAPDSGKTARLMVAPLTMEDADELFEVVAGVEASAARRAARLPTPQRVRVSTDLVELNAALARATRQPRPDENEIFDLDTAFHRAYVVAGAGPRILALHDSVKPQAERYIRLYINALVDRIADSIVEHEAIIEGIRRGEVEATEAAVLQNWRHASQRFSEVIARIGERGTW